TINRLISKKQGDADTIPLQCLDPTSNEVNFFSLIHFQNLPKLMKKNDIDLWDNLLPRRLKRLLLIMKITSVFMLLFCLHLHGEITAQTVTIHAQNSSVSDILEKVKQQT